MTIETAVSDTTSKAQPAPSDSQDLQVSRYWCNFCEFRSDDVNAYLSHSCANVLAARGVEVKPTGKNECS